ncbi:hypothetical protein SAMN04488030_2206 [Aliiroseovarius halocynthiae]|nr:hypothetical protein SAMN04488030_2206 [Aliiroseovarius halocynthiae]
MNAYTPSGNLALSISELEFLKEHRAREVLSVAELSTEHQFIASITQAGQSRPQNQNETSSLRATSAAPEIVAQPEISASEVSREVTELH